MSITQETRLKKAHIALMKHPETALYSGVIMMGKSSVSDNNITAYTDGINKVYGREFMEKLSDEELRGLIIHENLHVSLKHMTRFLKEFKADAQLTNASADYVVNDIIVDINKRHPNHIRLPEGGLYNAKYHNWSVREVYNDLKQEQENGNQPELESLDEHGFGEGDTANMTPEKAEQLSKQIDRALREGGILAGRMGGKTPRHIEDLLAPKVDWRAVLREFIMSVTRGNDEFTWRKFNKRYLANDYYLPSMENERTGELVIAIDTSGSIGSKELTEFASELVSICDIANPEKIRVLWWDTQVHGEQVFEDNYGEIAQLLKPQGGGGTEPSCIAKYIAEENINAEGVVVFTDGYFSEDFTWNIATPTLWLVTENDKVNVPSGKIIKQERVS
jgi:predicted metal-dependent peptidase